LTVLLGVVAVLGLGWGIWRDIDARRARAATEALRRRLDLMPLVEITGWAEWDPDKSMSEYPDLDVHADFTNHGPGEVRDVHWGVTIHGHDVPHGRHIPVMAAGTSEGTEARWIGSPEKDLVSTGNPHREGDIEWWVRYENRLGEHLEVRFTNPERMWGPHPR
jgi:hypothetical protein